ncbi:MAG TPA: VWA domain-containing protein [Methylococcaceae bacterium]|nr:VWA domain-containing protein [Methylococcaceae bacterium]
MGRLATLGWRFWCLLLACVLLALGFLRPVLPLKQPVFRYLFIVDITQSMNARDYRLEGLPADRLGFVKASLREVLHDLPCGSEVGLGLFTTRTNQVLFEPLEVCAHFPAIADALERLDWRMAWAADSSIAHGLFTAIREVAARGAGLHLAFFSDGDPFPPDDAPPPLKETFREVHGLIVGVGGAQPVPIPRLDRDNRPLGFWEYADLKDFLPSSATAGRRELDGGYYLSRLDESYLRELAAITGLGYYRLQQPEALSAALRAREFAEEKIVPTDMRPWLAALALGLFLLTLAL